MTQKIIRNIGHIKSGTIFDYISLIPSSHIAYKKEGDYPDAIYTSCPAHRMGGKGSSPYQEPDLEILADILSGDL